MIVNNIEVQRVLVDGVHCILLRDLDTHLSAIVSNDHLSEIIVGNNDNGVHAYGMWKRFVSGNKIMISLQCVENQKSFLQFSTSDLLLTLN